jgi:uncharacterized protein with von Willebrand factor type A (vWA) domain
MKRIDQFRWKRFEKRGRDLKFSLRQAYRTLGFALSWQRANFRNWNISLA